MDYFANRNSSGVNSAFQLKVSVKSYRRESEQKAQNIMGKILGILISKDTWPYFTEGFFAAVVKPSEAANVYFSAPIYNLCNHKAARVAHFGFACNLFYSAIKARRVCALHVPPEPQRRRSTETELQLSQHSEVVCKLLYLQGWINLCNKGLFLSQEGDELGRGLSRSPNC